LACYTKLIIALNNPLILGIESSCDDTAAAVMQGNRVLSNVLSTQFIHESYGGVVPEMAGRAHMENIVAVVDEALQKANVEAKDLDAIAFTQGPGLMVSLVVGTSFAKGLALSLNKPLIAVHHMKAHILSHFIEDERMSPPTFPYLCLTVSGGHTQLVIVHSPLSMEIIGKTIDDAAGEAFDKAAKMLGFPYPGGPHIDLNASQGNPAAFSFSKPRIEGLDFSFSGLKTSILYTLKKHQDTDPEFIQKNLFDLCASVQESITDILVDKLKKAQKITGIQHIALSGGVSINSGLRNKIGLWEKDAPELSFHFALPKYCTDNAAMIAMAGIFLYQEKHFTDQSVAAASRLSW
jgi:N6-L-threonylcarbamoyladenine synthase